MLCNNENRPIYVGMTMDNHIDNSSFVPSIKRQSECFNQTKLILYHTCISKSDMKTRHDFLITKHNPLYNHIAYNENLFTFEINDFDWKYFPKDDNFLFNRACEKLANMKSLNVTLNEIAYKNSTVNFLKNKKTKFVSIKTYPIKFEDGSYSLSATVINNEIYFFQNQIDSICKDSNHATSTQSTVNLIEKNILNHNEVIILEDSESIRLNTNSNTINANNKYLYPKRTALINVSGSIKYIDHLLKLVNDENAHQLKNDILSFSKNIQTSKRASLSC